MPLLKRKALLTKEPLKIVKVELSGDNFVFVRQMTGLEKDRFEQSLRQEVKDEKGRLEYQVCLDNFRAKLAVQTLCDEKGVSLLQPEDYAELSQNISAASLEKIVDIAQEINKITKEDKAVLIKNSEAAQSGDSISGSVKS